MIYFCLKPYLSPKESNYAHAAIALAEGLRELGVIFASNLEYWKYYNGEFLFKKNEKKNDYDIHIYSYTSVDVLDELCTNKFNILLDLEDGINTASNNVKFLKFDLILRSHYNKNIKYNKNVIPWAFGLTNRIIEAVNETSRVNIENKLYNSLRYPHNLRKMVVDNLSPRINKKYKIDEIITDSLDLDDIKGEDIHSYYWRITGRRHNFNFYENLNSSLLSYAVGGYEEYLPHNKNSITKYLSKIADKLSRNLGISNAYLMYLVQFDSWRWWEALYSNSVPIHMDFNSWDWVLPVNPVNYKHYIGVERYNFDKCIDFILNTPTEDLKQIGIEGKNWSYDNYSPKAVAERLLNICNYKV